MCPVACAGAAGTTRTGGPTFRGNDASGTSLSETLEAVVFFSNADARNDVFKAAKGLTERRCVSGGLVGFTTTTEAELISLIKSSKRATSYQLALCFCLQFPSELKRIYSYFFT